MSITISGVRACMYIIISLVHVTGRFRFSKFAFLHVCSYLHVLRTMNESEIQNYSCGQT